MLPRRQVLVGSALGIAGAALPMLRPKGSKASGVMDHHLLESLQVCTPKDALTRLKEGNARFAKAWTSASAAGTPEQVARVKASHTGLALKPMLAAAKARADGMQKPPARRKKPASAAESGSAT
jgi:hypothetical protein